jgi:hypothetical protein
MLSPNWDGLGADPTCPATHHVIRIAWAWRPSPKCWRRFVAHAASLGEPLFPSLIVMAGDRFQLYCHNVPKIATIWAAPTSLMLSSIVPITTEAGFDCA